MAKLLLALLCLFLFVFSSEADVCGFDGYCPSGRKCINNECWIRTNTVCNLLPARCVGGGGCFRDGSLYFCHYKVMEFRKLVICPNSE